MSDGKPQKHQRTAVGFFYLCAVFMILWSFADFVQWRQIGEYRQTSRWIVTTYQGTEGLVYILVRLIFGLALFVYCTVMSRRNRRLDEEMSTDSTQPDDDQVA